MESFKPAELYDAIGSFPQGINSGIDYELLPKTQLGYAINATLRGTFPSPRPPWMDRVLTFDTESVQSAFQNGRFQGGGIYKPDAGISYAIAVISGRFYSINLGSYEVQDITGSLTPNSADVPRAWMWQSEKWMIIQNGVDVPLIYDGETLRRSTQSTIYATIAAAQPVVPSTLEAFTVTTLAPYTGANGETVLIKGYQFAVNLVGAASPSVSLTNLRDTAGTSYPTGTNLVNNPNRIGYLTSPFSGFDGSAYVDSETADNYFWIELTAAVSASQQYVYFPATKHNPSNGSTSTTTIRGTIVDRDATNAKRVRIRMHYAPPIGSQQRAYDFTALTTTPCTYGTALPTAIVGTTSEAFTAPVAGSTVSVDLAASYTGANDASVWISDSQYSIQSLIGPNTSLSIQLTPLTAPANLSISNEDIYSVPEIPIGRMGAYGMGRNWICLADGVSFVASDIVGGSSGSQTHNYRDAVLKMIENTFLAGGGAFRVPVSGDEITAMRFGANLDASLGQGPLQVFVHGGAFPVLAPVDRTTWQSLTNPILPQSLIGNGSESHDATIVANSDFWYRSIDGIRSFKMARRNFTEDGNTPQSLEVSRLLNEDDTSMLGYSSSISFDNRLLATANPVQSVSGVYHTSLAVMNFDSISTLGTKLPKIYDGEWTDKNIFKLLTGIVSGVERAFAFTCDSDRKIGLSELLRSSDPVKKDNETTDIEFTLETPSLDFNVNRRVYKQLRDGEVYVDDLSGEVTFKVYYRPDQYPTWTLWHQWTETDADGTFRPRMGIGEPSPNDADSGTQRPMREGHVFQVKIVITGQCKFKGASFMAVSIPQAKYAPPKAD